MGCSCGSWLRSPERASTDVTLRKLARELEHDLGGTAISIRLGDARLNRRLPVAPPSTPLDVAAELRKVLTALTDDEQRHFIPKGQGAEQGELVWYFQGRQAEQRHIGNWLRSHDTGLLVVTGRPGSGKSALLGQVLTQSRPLLRRTLARHHLLPEAPTDDDSFDTTLLLTGLAPTDVVTAIAAGTVASGRQPAEREPQSSSLCGSSVSSLSRVISGVVVA